MNLLIVDDEYFSRENIKELLPWSKYGIDHIEEADDGVNAELICENYTPDIILTDVKMPRRDGIELSFNMRNKFPNCSIIFMSGYSDKEYLKSAIKLKAIGYVEKPVLKEELEEAVLEAVELYKQALLLKEQKSRISMHSDAISSWMRSELTLQLISKNIDEKKLQNQLRDLSVDIPLKGCFATILLKLYNADNHDIEQYHKLIDSAFTIIRNSCEKTDVRGIWTKEDNLFIMHVYESSSDENIFMREKINKFSEILRNSLMDKKMIFAMGIGRVENRLNKLADSYKTAVLALNHSFFKEAGHICYFKEGTMEKFIFEESFISEYSSKLTESSEHYTLCFIKSLTSDIKRYENTTENEIKRFYFNLLSELMHVSRKKLVDVFTDFSGDHEVWEYILTLHFLHDLEEFLLYRTSRYFHLLEEKIDNNGPVDLIIKYIHHNYQNEILSLTLISDEMKLAPSYISCIFKKRTGKNLNQYITEYRIEKAKELLEQKLIKISDITVLVGYRDGNYFAKLFKKHTGMSPSEYRGNC